METKSNTIEAQANAVSKATSKIDGTFNWDKALNPENDDSQYFIAATAIVEPTFLDEEAIGDYYNLMENDPDNWVGFITNTCGEQWGELARVSLEYGY